MVNEDALRAAFEKVGKEKEALEAEIRQIKGVLEEIRAEIKALKETPKSEDPTLPEEDSSQSSIGNQGAPPTTTINHQYPSTINKQSPSMINMKEELETLFRTLTDREFSIFMAIYAIDKEGGEANYHDVAKQLNISDHTIRGYISTLLSKGIPIKKERYLNGKVSLSIKNEFKQLDLYQKLLRLRAEKSGQKTLFDI